MQESHVGPKWRCGTSLPWSISTTLKAKHPEGYDRARLDGAEPQGRIQDWPLGVLDRGFALPPVAAAPLPLGTWERRQRAPRSALAKLPPGCRGEQITQIWWHRIACSNHSGVFPAGQLILHQTELPFFNLGVERAVYSNYAFTSLVLMPWHVRSQKVVPWYLNHTLKDKWRPCNYIGGKFIVET